MTTSIAEEYPILSARYANADGTAIIIQTAEFAAVAVSLDRPELWQHVQDWISAGGQVDPLEGPMLG